jgi:hypothetical protein
MSPSLENDRNWWSKSLTWPKGNLLPRIKGVASPGSYFTGTQHTISASSATPGPGNAALPEERGETMKIPDFTFHAFMTNSTDIESSGDGRQPAYIGKAKITSSAIFDDSFDVTPKRPASKSFSDSNRTQSIKTPTRVASPTAIDPDTASSSLSTYVMDNAPTYRKNDELTPAEVFDTAPAKTSKILAIFDRMHDFSFQDADGKWQPYYRTDGLNASKVIDASPTESSDAFRVWLSLPQSDVKGKRPIYHEFTENFDAISPIYIDCVADVQPRESPTSALPVSKASPTPFKCTCTPSDTKLALELYLRSTKQQHKQLEHVLRRSGPLSYLSSTSTRDCGLVQKLSKLHLNVDELYKLVMAEEIVSSVVLTEIHRLMDKALTPVSEQFLVLYLEILGLRAADNGWRQRKWLIQRKMREDWEARMGGLASKVDQANAWVQLVGIRISRARIEW